MKINGDEIEYGSNKITDAELPDLLLDLVGVTVGYFAAVWLRFGNIETGYTVMGNDTYYRWLIAIVVLMMIYFLFRPNRGFLSANL